jgi:hypothetical protein
MRKIQVKEGGGEGGVKNRNYSSKIKDEIGNSVFPSCFTITHTHKNISKKIRVKKLKLESEKYKGILENFFF